MKKIEKSTTTNSLFVDFLKFYLWLFVAFSTKIPQTKWPGYEPFPQTQACKSHTNQHVFEERSATESKEDESFK